MTKPLAVAAAAALPLGAIAAEPPARVEGLEERVRVERVLLAARVLDPEGRPVLGLGPSDFEVVVGDAVVSVESVDWFEGLGGDRAGPSRHETTGPRHAVPPSAGSLTVLLVQRDLDPSRIVGLMKTLPPARSIVEGMGPEDRLAILVFDRRLHLLADFTSDRDALVAILEGSIAHLDEEPPSAPPPDGPSLRAHLDERLLRRTAHVETALLRIGEALTRLPGPKTVLFFAWGMGVRSGDVLMTRPDQGRAVRALREARATLLTLDVTIADAHTLESPLIATTRDTGGLYVKGHPHAAVAVERLRNAASGQYVLAFEPPPGAGRRDSIRVRVPGRDVEVLHREFL